MFLKEVRRYDVSMWDYFSKSIPDNLIISSRYLLKLLLFGCDVTVNKIKAYGLKKKIKCTRE